MLGIETINGFELIDFYCIFPAEDILSSLLDQVVELASTYVAIQDFFYFLSWFAFNNNGFWGRYDVAW
jgi:hypothetical protein